MIMTFLKKRHTLKGSVLSTQNKAWHTYRLIQYFVVKKKSNKKKIMGPLKSKSEVKVVSIFVFVFSVQRWAVQFPVKPGYCYNTTGSPRRLYMYYVVVFRSVASFPNHREIPTQLTPYTLDPICDMTCATVIGRKEPLKGSIKNSE